MQSKGSSIKISRHADAGRSPLWKTKDRLSQKRGPHATIYLINGDEYIGEWDNNLKHGKGIYFFSKNGYQYEGEFQIDMRCGNGTLSIPINEKAKQENNGSDLFEKQSNGRTSANYSKESPLRKVYTGAWFNDKRHGQGTYFYKDGSVYKGAWVNDMKEGWGIMTYANGNVYEGEFYREKRHGQGVLLLSKLS